MREKLYSLEKEPYGEFGEGFLSADWNILEI